MTKRYTPADFANARFAEHESGQAVAIRWTQDYAREPDGFWTYERPLNNKFSKEATHQEMADMDGWVPVPTKPTITESQMVKVYGAAVEEMAVFQYALESVGIEVIPDPEPTNTDILAKLLGEVATDAGVNLNPRLFAEQLDNAGVTVRKEDN